MSSIHEALRRARQMNKTSSGSLPLVQHRDLLGSRKRSKAPLIVILIIFIAAVSGTASFMVIKASDRVVPAHTVVSKPAPASPTVIASPSAPKPVPVKKAAVIKKPVVARVEEKKIAAPKETAPPVKKDLLVAAAVPAVKETATQEKVAAKTKPAEKLPEKTGKPVSAITRARVLLAPQDPIQAAVANKTIVQSLPPDTSTKVIKKPVNKTAKKAAPVRIAPKQKPVVRKKIIKETFLKKAAAPKPLKKKAIKTPAKLPKKTETIIAVAKPSNPEPKKSRLGQEAAKTIYNQALLSQKKGRYDQAIQLYREALKLDPLLVQAHLNLGNIFLHRKNMLDKARESYLIALEIDPGSKFGHNNLGYLYLKRKMYDQAEAEFANAIALDKDYVDALYNMACVFASKGQKTEAMVLLRQAAENEPEVRNWASTDDDLKPLRSLKDFQAFVNGDKK